MNTDNDVSIAYDTARAAYHAYRAVPEARIAARRRALARWTAAEAILRKAGGTAEVVRQMLVARAATGRKKR